MLATSLGDKWSVPRRYREASNITNSGSMESRGVITETFNAKGID